MDNDYDLDFIVAYQTGNEVVWYANDGPPILHLVGVINWTVSSARYLELIDSNDSASLGNYFNTKILLSPVQKAGIYLAVNDGKVYLLTQKLQTAVQGRLSRQSS